MAAYVKRSPLRLCQVGEDVPGAGDLLGPTALALGSRLSRSCLRHVACVLILRPAQANVAGRRRRPTTAVAM